MKAKNKCLLLILDGWGLLPTKEGNAPYLANTPTLDYIYATYPKTSIVASGLEVGLGPGEVGNSEVGHLNLGSGRVAWQDLPRINQAIENEEFYQNTVLLGAIEHTKKNDGTLHLWGLVSNGGVHSHIDHYLALLNMASKQKVSRVLVHFIADGRDTGPKEALQFVAQLEEGFERYHVGKISTVVGRYYAMDRDKNWDRVKKGYDLVTQNVGTHYETAKEAIEKQYEAGLTDEFLEPAVVGEGGVIKPGDAVIMVNYRNDRPREMFDLFCDPKVEAFPHSQVDNLYLCTMCQYRKNQSAPVAFPKTNMLETLAEVISRHGLSQFHVAETEKYAHVTFFFNGGREEPFEDEKQVIVPSKKVATYDQAPEMSASEISQEIQEALASKYDFIVANFANGDMVGHTGNLEAAIRACEKVDAELASICAKASDGGYRVLITADHGNCEVMIDEITGGPNKEHTINPVPFVHLDFERLPFILNNNSITEDEYQQYSSGSPVGILADVGPSVLAILGVPQPPEMAGMDLTVAL